MSIRLPYPKPTSASATAVMRGNRSVDTKPEVALRTALHARGFRFRKNYLARADSRAIRIDIAFPGKRVAIFVDGCFWHRCRDHGTSPQANAEYWLPKLQRNVDRDVLVNQLLSESGWKVLRIWEHTSLEQAVALISDALGVGTGSATSSPTPTDGG